MHSYSAEYKCNSGLGLGLGLGGYMKFTGACLTNPNPHPNLRRL